jgi:hypothetical protein
VSASHLPDNLFRSCCGPDFDRLPEAVRRAHLGRTRLKGRVRVHRGGAVACLLAEIVGLPRAAESVEMAVDGEHHTDRMIWDRRFGDQQFRSCFTHDGVSLVESMGPLRLHLRLAVREHRVHYLLQRVSVWHLPWPRAFAPNLEAWEGERAVGTMRLRSRYACRSSGGWCGTRGSSTTCLDPLPTYVIPGKQRSCVTRDP